MDDAKKEEIKNKAKETREANAKEEARLKEIIPLSINVSTHTAELLERKLAIVGMSKEAFIAGCVRSYTNGRFQMLDGMPFFIGDTHKQAYDGKFKGV